MESILDESTPHPHPRMRGRGLDLPLGSLFPGWPECDAKSVRPRGNRTSYPQGVHRIRTGTGTEASSTNRQEIQEASIVHKFVEKAWAHGEQAVEKRGQPQTRRVGPQGWEVAHIGFPHSAHMGIPQRPRGFQGLSTLSTAPTTSTACTKETRSNGKRSGSIAQKVGGRTSTMWVMRIATELDNGGDLP